ncbi:MAG: protein kinase domain-containing protein, partial [Flavisolibacter sp.]
TPKLTQLGFVVGTTEYMAPEQFQQEVNKKSDVWSLGVMVYEMLTGHLPFDAGNPISLRAMIMKGKFTDPRILVPHVSENLSIIIDRSLRINPASRMPAEEIEDLLRGKPKKMNESETWKLPSWNWKSWMYLPIGLALVIFLFLVFSNNNAAVTPPETTDSIAVINQGVKTTALKLIINVPSVPDARIVLSDGSVHAIPYIISGEEGSKLDFLIRADGYEEKKVQGLEFNTRRTTYEYRLKKINQ